MVNDRTAKDSGRAVLNTVFCRGVTIAIVNLTEGDSVCYRGTRSEILR